jgi:hypothetical protein
MVLPLAPSPLASPPAPMLPRRLRGGRPGNRNAFCHGLLSARHPSSLAVISACSMLLIECSSHERGIPRGADSFRGKINKSDLKSSHPLGIFPPFLEEPISTYVPDRQWAVIEPLIPPVKEDYSPEAALPPRLRVCPPGVQDFTFPSSPSRSSVVPQKRLPRTFSFSCQSSRLGVSLSPGVVRSRRASRSSKPAAGRVAGRGGFDPHPLPPFLCRSSLITRHSSLVTRHSSIVNRKS